MKNKLVSNILYEIADLLDIRNDNFFKIRAYRIAAQKIEMLDEDIEKVIDEKRIGSIPGIGDVLAKKIEEIVKTGGLKYLDELKKEIPSGLLEFLKIPTMGPKKISTIYNNLSITSIPDLKKACQDGKLQSLEGFGVITECNILRGINTISKISGRVMLNLAYNDGNEIVEYLKESPYIKRISIAGSLRRMKESIGDIDVLVSSEKPDDVMNFFVKYHDVQNVLLKGITKTSIVLNDNLQVDLRVVDDKSFGSALQYFTGSKEHNVKMRSLAIKKGLKLNEYGLFDKKSGKYIVKKKKKEIYQKLGLEFIEPELRENRGEIEAAEKNKLPKIVGYDDIQGDLHVHSNMSDGFNSIDEMVHNSKKIGYKYVGIADHSQSLKIANGLSEERVNKKIQEIEKINKKNDDFFVFCGTECDIKSDGSLDYPNKILKKFDYVGIAIHSAFKMDKEKATERIIKGMQNDHVNFLAHPTCRLIGSI